MKTAEDKLEMNITCGVGFIGSHVIRRFINKYSDYHIFLRL